MPLLDLQTALATLVTQRASAGHTTADALAPLAGLNLTADERAWLAQLNGAPGFDVTCYIQRWWRETKLRWTTRLTLAALGPEQGAALLKDYLDATPCSSLFFTPEALGFLDFVAREATALPHMAEIARFERAMIIVKDAVSQFAEQYSEANELRPEDQLASHPAAALLELAAPPEELLGALVQGHSLPPARAERFPVLIAPGLPHLWRPATPDEARLFAGCQPASTVASLLAQAPGSSERTLRRLLRAGAVQAAT